MIRGYYKVHKVCVLSFLGFGIHLVNIIQLSKSDVLDNITIPRTSMLLKNQVPIL